MTWASEATTARREKSNGPSRGPSNEKTGLGQPGCRTLTGNMGQSERRRYER